MAATAQARDPRLNAFRVSRWINWLTALACDHPRLWIRLGNLETRSVADRIEGLRITQPVFIAGLARSGSTILLEMLASHPDVATHRYRDFPMLFTPCWWQRFLDTMPAYHETPMERAHADGIVVTPKSPEAMEEILWAGFHPGLHDPGRCQLLSGDYTNASFEDFFRAHVRKLLWVRGATRYVSKNNYNLTRLEYLHKLFPDARFVVPIRDPVWHLASSIKQHSLFCTAQRRHPRSRSYLRRAVHFEFGLDRSPINTGDQARVDEILELWRAGEELHGWARYWRLIHEPLAEQLRANAALRQAVLVVPHAFLCERPADTIRQVFAHGRLPLPEPLLARLSQRVRAPQYYTPQLTDAQRAVIEEQTASVWQRLLALAP